MSAFKKIFHDSKGNIVIAQRPNKPLIAAGLFYLIQFLPFSASSQISKWGVTIFLGYWALMEIFSGVNLWRRMLGFIVLIWMIL